MQNKDIQSFIEKKKKEPITWSQKNRIREILGCGCFKVDTFNQYEAYKFIKHYVDVVLRTPNNTRHSWTFAMYTVLCLEGKDKMIELLSLKPEEVIEHGNKIRPDIY